MHYTPDISEYVNFHFYQWCYYWNEVEKEKEIGRWLSVAHQVGQSLCYWDLDRHNGNSYWQDAIKKENDNVKLSFCLMKEEDGERVPPGFKEINCHLIFEVKFDLRRKARYVAGGHLTEPPSADSERADPADPRPMGP